MNKLILFAKRYKFFIVLFVINVATVFISPNIGKSALDISKANMLEMLAFLPPIFVLLGLLDVWVERETMIKYMGKDAGIKGSAIAFVMGSAAAGPLYAAFPLAMVLLKKGASLSNVFIFIGAWSTTKIPMMLFEASNLGIKYMLVRWAFNIFGIVIIAVLLERTTSAKDKELIYKQANNF